MHRLTTYLRESRAELSKVTWPTRAQAIRLTILVIIFSAILGLFIGIVDYFFVQIVQKLLLKG